MSGFIAMSRAALDHPLLQDPDRFYAWFWLVANACWKPSRARIKGQVITLDRGELTFSVRFLAKRWGWSKSKVDRFLSELREQGMISTRSKIGTPDGTTTGHTAGQGQSIITICNYDKYQDAETRARDDARDNSGTQTGTRAGQQRDKEEQGNKGTSIPVSNDTGANSDFDPGKAFWDGAKAYLGKSKAGLIGKWVRDYGQEETAKAITAAQIARAVDPVPYVERTLRGTRSSDYEMPVC